MNFRTFGNDKAPTLLLIPGLGVSYEIFLPLIRLTEESFRVIAYVREHHGGHLSCAYGLSLGGKILSRMLERNELTIDHAILDAAPLLPLPNWLINPLRYYQAVSETSAHYLSERPRSSLPRHESWPTARGSSRRSRQTIKLLRC